MQPGTGSPGVHMQLFPAELGPVLPSGKLLPVTAWGMLAIITVCVCVLTPVSGFCISIMSVSICKAGHGTGWDGMDFRSGQEGAPGPPQLQAAFQRGGHWCATGMDAVATALSEPPLGTRGATCSPWQLTLTCRVTATKHTHTEPGLAQEGQDGTPP